jgi:phage-related protein
MAAPDFPLPYGPIFPVEIAKEPRLNISNYGDGYEQVSGDGINTLKPSTEVVWDALTQAEANLADSFMEGLGGAKTFMWQYPGDAVKTRWTCRKWKKSFHGPNNYGFSGTFIRSFNPD